MVVVVDVEIVFIVEVSGEVMMVALSWWPLTCLGLGTDSRKKGLTMFGLALNRCTYSTATNGTYTTFTVWTFPSPMLERGRCCPKEALSNAELGRLEPVE